jgi:hypothetical protein
MDYIQARKQDSQQLVTQHSPLFRTQKGHTLFLYRLIYQTLLSIGINSHV